MRYSEDSAVIVPNVYLELWVDDDGPTTFHRLTVENQSHDVTVVGLPQGPSAWSLPSLETLDCWLHRNDEAGNLRESVRLTDGDTELINSVLAGSGEFEVVFSPL